jgi:alkylhydroperoxidase family enzyme
MPRIHPLTPEQITEDIRAAFEHHKAEYNARITNMKSTMGKALPVFKVYMEWYDLYREVIKITGERMAYLFAHAVSQGSNCPLCTTFFRKIIIEHGEKPEELVLSADEQTLLDFGSAMANNKGEVPDELYRLIAATYTEAEIIILIGFAGQMIATNIFNNALEVQIDEYLGPYVSVKS